MPSQRFSDRRRLLWSFLASAILNVIIWVASSAHLELWRNAPQEQPRETVAVSVSPVRFERRPRATPRPKLKPTPQPKPPTPQPAQAPLPLPKPPPPVTPRHVVVAIKHHVKKAPPQGADQPMLAPPPPATLAVPRGWTRQDFGFLGTTETAEWLNWKNQSARWVPRIFVWRIKAEEGYMSRSSLQSAVKEMVSSLHDEGAKLYASKAQRVCGGQRPGWFLSYVKPEDDPPLHLEETIFMDGETIYRATYIRAADQKEDPQTREALNSLCV